MKTIRLIITAVYFFITTINHNTLCMENQKNNPEQTALNAIVIDRKSLKRINPWDINPNPNKKNKNLIQAQ